MNAPRSLARIYWKFRKGSDPVGYARFLGVRVGDGCRLLNVSFSSEPYLITLGNHVSASRTHFETHDGGVWVLRQENPDVDIVRPVTVGDNVYLGYETKVMPGVTIGDNVVVGAGAIVTKDLPSNSVAVGIPARVIKTFSEYEAKALAEAERTKNLAPEEKRRFYELKFRKGEA